MTRHVAVLLQLIALTGCGIFSPSDLPLSAGEKESGYTYVPIDPFPVITQAGEGCEKNQKPPRAKLLDSLPDNAVRMLVERFEANGGVTYGPSKVGGRGQSYRVTVDYINADTINKRVWIRRSFRDAKGDRLYVGLLTKPSFSYVEGTEEFEIRRKDPKKDGELDFHEFNIPIYVGVGLRVAANITVTGWNANISGISVIGAEADANRLKGSLIVQTLGINGKSVAAALPIQSELNQTTAQSAIVAVSSIKAQLHTYNETVVSPRVVGLYLPFPGGKPLVNSLISELSQEPLEWKQQCLVQTTSIHPAGEGMTPEPLTPQ